MKKYILEHFDPEGYDLEASTPIRQMEEIFLSEMGWQIPRKCQIKTLTDWLQGLPSCLDLPFYDHDIEALLEAQGVIDVNTKLSRKEKLIENYWNYTANMISQLFTGYRVPK